MMILFWLLLGALTASAFWYVYLKFHVPGKMSKLSWTSALSTILMAAFTLAWAVASWDEGEMRAAAMGLMIFGGSTIVLIACTKKLLSKQQDTVAVEKVT